MSEHHHHDHAHHHGPVRHDRAFALGVTLNLAFIAVELIAGLSADSLALLADAGHNFSDVLSLLLAWGADWLARRGPDGRRTYGYGRGAIMASTINAVILYATVAIIVWEAVQRLAAPQPAQPGVVMLVAGVGVVINTATALLFLRGGHDINIRGAFLHMAADAAVSAGVALSALLILWTGATWIDPLASLAVAGVIAWGTWGLLRESLNLSLDASPEQIDLDAVRSYLQSLPGVVQVHDLHIWALSTTRTALTAHLVRPGAGPDDAFLTRAAQELRERFGIEHATMQVEEERCGEGC